MAAVKDTIVGLTADQIRLVAEDFILDHIGDQVTAGQPWLVQSMLGSAWIIPLVLTSSAYGPVGGIGALVIDESTGQVVASTPLETLKTNADRLTDNRQSELETAFWQAITGENERH